MTLKQIYDYYFIIETRKVLSINKRNTKFSTTWYLLTRYMSISVGAKYPIGLLELPSKIIARIVNVPSLKLSPSQCLASRYAAATPRYGFVYEWHSLRNIPLLDVDERMLW